MPLVRRSSATNGNRILPDGETLPKPAAREWPPCAAVRLVTLTAFFLALSCEGARLEEVNPATTDEPVFDRATDAVVYQDNMDGYTDITSMGRVINPSNDSVPRIVPYPSPATNGQPVNTTTNQLISGRGGAGKALRMSFDGVAQDQATFIAWYMPWKAGPPATDYFQYWARVNVSRPLNGSTLAVKWFEAWHFVAGQDRVQWNTHNALPCPTGIHPNYWQVYDGSRQTTCQGNQPIGPYFDNITDNQWHRYTFAYRPNSAPGARDGFARMWIDGVRIIDISATTIGVTPPAGENPWCSADDVDALSVNPGTDAIDELRWGSVQTTNTPPWTLDIDDFIWWRPR